MIHGNINTFEYFLFLSRSLDFIEQDSTFHYYQNHKHIKYALMPKLN